jgi:rubredoxin
MQRCQNCKFVAYDYEIGDYNCRRFPPVTHFDSRTNTLWTTKPLVDLNQVCGEYSPSEGGAG